MPLRREKERQKLERDVKEFLKKGGEIDERKATDRAEVTVLSNQAKKMISYPRFMQGFME